MDLTFGSINISRYLDIIGKAILPLGILALVAMLVLPLPTSLLDTFFVSNILVSLLILMVALHTYRPLDFSSFPNLLLIATIFRLALNVASTRIVLTEGHTGSNAAGQVIEAFGKFVIAGNYTVGIFVFVILVIINLIVITKGAGRVAEVSARFTLDAMPGKQMAIDADLNAGVLTPEEATERREEIAKEADFYGAMDGSSKFVKGDAIAGILILIINIVGGIIIGISQKGLPIATAAETYILLSIGDGLVAQIPSLLLAISTAIIVTRVSSNHDMATHIGKQISISRAWLPVAGVLALIGLVPGMPTGLFLIAAIVAAGAGFAAKNFEDKNLKGSQGNLEGSDVSEGEENREEVDLSDVTDYAPISIQLGYGLVEMVDNNSGGPLVNRITGIRKQVSKSLGFVVPNVRIRDDLSLEANQYRIRIGQTIVGEDEIFPDKKLAIPGDEATTKVQGIEVKDPTFGMDAIWISNFQQNEAEANGYVVVAPESVLATHLSQILSKHSAQLIGQDDVQVLLDNLAQSAPSLVQSVVPKLVPLHNLTSILRTLLNERVPVSDLRCILENLAVLSSQNLSVTDTAEALRPHLSGLLVQQVAPLNQPIQVITLSGELENMLIKMVRQSGDEGLILDANLAQQLIKGISEAQQKVTSDGKTAVLVVSPAIRRQFASILKQHIEDLLVLAFTELPDNRQINVVATISSE
ncbi:MAG: flagellar biosynthesis protein FlhA [Paracoccaceae bacterium]